MLRIQPGPFTQPLEHAWLHCINNTLTVSGRFRTYTLNEIFVAIGLMESDELVALNQMLIGRLRAFLDQLRMLDPLSATLLPVPCKKPSPFLVLIEHIRSPPGCRIALNGR
ncbi:hypothetical protein D3C71_1215200 [compost metagenome]